MYRYKRVNRDRTFQCSNHVTHDGFHLSRQYLKCPVLRALSATLGNHFCIQILVELGHSPCRIIHHLFVLWVLLLHCLVGEVSCFAVTMRIVLFNGQPVETKSPLANDVIYMCVSNWERARSQHKTAEVAGDRLPWGHTDGAPWISFRYVGA